jgi:hypothetical protein
MKKVVKDFVMKGVEKDLEIDLVEKVKLMKKVVKDLKTKEVEKDLEIDLVEKVKLMKKVVKDLGKMVEICFEIN